MSKVFPTALLAVSAASSTASLCSPSKEDPCAITCDDGRSFDLSGFKTQSTSSFFHYEDKQQQQDFYFDACAAMSTVRCAGSTVTSPAAIQTFGAPKPEPPNFPASTCAVLGEFSMQQCSSSKPGTVLCEYGGGDGDRSVAFEYTCAPSYVPPTASQPDPTSAPARYVIKFAGPAACAGGSTCGLSHDSPTVFDDMHDGDQKQISLLSSTSIGSKIEIAPYNNSQKWRVLATLNGANCTATIDFNVPGKPNPPPVNLLASVRQFAQPWGTDAFKSLVLFTDPSGKLAPSSKPLNAWVEDD